MQPQNSNDQFDFILKDDPKPKKPTALPTSNLPRPVIFGLAAIAGIVVVILFFSLVLGNKGSSFQPLIESIGRAEEISRVTASVKQQTNDPDTKNLAATVASTMDSEQAQLTSYLTSNKQKVDPKKLLVYQNKAIDAQLETAAQNNSLEKTYLAYLQQSLTAYQNSLNTAYKTSGPKGKEILRDAYNSVKTILSAPQFSQGS